MGSSSKRSRMITRKRAYNTICELQIDPVSCRSTSSSPPAIRLHFGDWKHVKDRKFSGFVRKALDSCLDYDSLSFPIPGSMIEVEELTFCLKKILVGIFPRNCESSVLRLLAGAQSRHAIFHENIVVKTFYEAEKAHEGQVFKLGQLSKLARDNNTASKTIEADRLHTMFLVMTDARVVLMKLAGRLHNMMTVGQTIEICKRNTQNFRSPSKQIMDIHLEGAARESLLQTSPSRASPRMKLNMDEILDIHGVRLVVENKDVCFAALNVIHRLWPKVVGKFKDYIVCLKFNE
ncbi:hypothetical protein KSP40_PGU016398 [Platanthera guangdongensis]|uniref:RelA/SpoT domain-containing protein n=1 Tax=Platanthera guangdongensis TaxID=2320717 RepID=A0ABR2LXZ4_9ASPA